MELHAPLPRRQAVLWALTLGLGLLAALAWGHAQLRTGADLCADTLRLHIRADNDTPAAQTQKLQVRDRVLALFDGCPARTPAEARQWAAQNLPRIQLEAQAALAEAGAPGPVQVQLVNMYFDTTRYAAGALPAGRYDAVRVELGTGPTGQNWWCVLYPGLCRAACADYALPQENDLVCGEYLLRFKLVEWWQGRTQGRADVLLAGTSAAPAA